jgi:chromosome segregation ATPase
MNSADTAKTGAAAELEQLKADMHRQVEDARKKGIDMVDELSQEHKAKMTDIYEQHKRELKDLQERLSSSHQERVDGMRDKHKAEVDELKQKYETQLKQATDAHSKQLEAQAMEHRAKVEKLEDEIKTVADKYATEIKQLQSELLTKAKEIEDLQATVQRLERRSADAEAAVARLEVNLKTAEREREEAIQKKEEDFAKEKRSLKEQHKAELENMIQDQLRETTQLKEQFDRARQLQDEQIEMLQLRVQELQELYDSRPSREEDVERIHALEAEVEEKENVIKRLLDEMQFYKLELVNREQNYNKVFGASPLVGTLNPVAAQGQAKGKKGAAEPQMRVVQQPGANMQMGLPPLGNLVAGGPPPGPPPAAARKKGMEKRPSSGNMTSPMPTANRATVV